MFISKIDYNRLHSQSSVIIFVFSVRCVIVCHGSGLICLITTNSYFALCICQRHFILNASKLYSVSQRSALSVIGQYGEALELLDSQCGICDTAVEVLLVFHTSRSQSNLK